MATLTKSTQTFATHEIPLECDVYEAPDYPKSSPVCLFFHSGGLVTGGRWDIPPWLVQTCAKNRWPLVSASYRLLPQVDGEGLLEDARAAYVFAKKLGTSGEEAERRVIATGASAGFFMATIIAHHLEPKPLALLASSGIPTFRHPFFSSGTILTEELVEDDDIERFSDEPVSVGTTPSSVFGIDSVLPSGEKNPDFKTSSVPPVDRKGQDPNRGMLYEHLVRTDSLLPFVHVVDPGFMWANDRKNPRALEDWPFTILLQGDKDEDVDQDVCQSVSDSLGNRALLIMVKGAGHRFGRTSFLEDRVLGMDKIQLATQVLEWAVADSLKK